MLLKVQKYEYDVQLLNLNLHYGLRYLSVLENVDAAILMASQVHGIAFRVDEDVVEFADFKFFNDF